MKTVGIMGVIASVNMLLLSFAFPESKSHNRNKWKLLCNTTVNYKVDRDRLFVTLMKEPSLS